MPRGRGCAGRVAMTSPGRDEEVDGQVVRQHRDALGDDLERVHRGEDRRRLADLALLAQEPVLEIAVAAALAEASPVASHGDRAADDEIDRPHLARRDGAAVAARAGDARREQRAASPRRCGSISTKHFSVRSRGTAM